jgi:ribosomal protein S1
LKVISLDSDRHRLGLSLKQAEEAPPRVAEPRERRPRQDRGYDASQAIQEPEGGIDNTLAAAFAQVRQQIAEQDAARRIAAAEATTTDADVADRSITTESGELPVAQAAELAVAEADQPATAGTDEPTVGEADAPEAGEGATPEVTTASS